MEDLIYKSGDRIANYQVIGFIGGGGFSAIYKVRDLNDDAKAGLAALKISRSDFRTVSRDKRVELNAKMWREQDELGLLEHQNIVRVYEWGLHEGKAWYVMELLQGPTLGRYLAEERRTFLELMLTFRQVVEAVAHCHMNGVIHRDLKPSNVMVTPQRGPVVQQDDEDRSGGPDRRSPSERLKTRLAVLIDFGIGHLLGEAPVTASGELVGTLEYLPPWYARELLAIVNGQPALKPYQAEPRDDVYQLAVMLYSLLTGLLPVRTPSGQRVALLEEIRDGVPVHPRQLNPEAPAALSELAMRCLDKHGAGIPADGAAFRVALLEALHADGESLRVKAPEFLAGQETRLGTAQLASLAAARAPARQETVSAPAHVLAEAEGLTPSARAAPQPGTSLIPTVDARPNGKSYLVPLASGACVMAAATALVFIGLMYRMETRARRDEERRERLETAQAKNADALGEAAHALHLAAMARVSGQFPMAVVPFSPAPLLVVVTGGLKMPDRPRPTWLRPDKDGVCRNPQTGEKVRSQVVIRGSCWAVSRRLPGGSCPDSLYDPPPEMMKDPKQQEMWERCFEPWTLEGGSSMEPQP